MTLVKNNHDVKDFMPKSFTDIIDNFFNETITSAAVNFLPRADVTESEKHYEIQLALPGVKKEEIKIDFQEGKLTISGERKFEKEETGKKYHTVETPYGAFKRSFHLPDKINHEGISAEFVDGILTVNIPKDEKKIAKTSIQVK